MTNRGTKPNLGDFLLFLQQQCHLETALESLDPSNFLRLSGARGLADQIIQFAFDKFSSACLFRSGVSRARTNFRGEFWDPVQFIPCSVSNAMIAADKDERCGGHRTTLRLRRIRRAEVA